MLLVCAVAVIATANACLAVGRLPLFEVGHSYLVGLLRRAAERLVGGSRVLSVRSDHLLALLYVGSPTRRLL